MEGDGGGGWVEPGKTTGGSVRWRHFLRNKGETYIQNSYVICLTMSLGFSFVDFFHNLIFDVDVYVKAICITQYVMFRWNKGQV